MIINETENCIREDTMKPRRSRRGRGQRLDIWIYLIDNPYITTSRKEKICLPQNSLPMP